MSHRFRSAGTTLLATAALLATLPAARAGAASSPDVLYKWLSCNPGTTTTATLSTMTIQPDNHGFVTGTIEPCGPAGGVASFGVAGYDSTGKAEGMLIPFSRVPGGHGAFTTGFPLKSTTVAVCVIANQTTRLTCATVDSAAQTGVAVPVTPLPTNASAVSIPAPTDMYGPNMRDGQPGCPTCWS